MPFFYSAFDYNFKTYTRPIHIVFYTGGTPLVLETLRPLDGNDHLPRNSLTLNIPAFNKSGLDTSGNSTSATTTTTAYSMPTTAATSSPATPNSSHDQFSVKMRQEVYVMQRVNELQRDGMWTDRRLPKVQEPQRPKAHWDYLLEEMVWLAADFAQERKWKKAAAKKCSRMVQKYFQDKAVAAQKAERAHELQLKRIASFQSKEIKQFWANVERLVEFKQQTKLEEKRKKALDQHLSFIVDQTEKFSAQLTEGMNKVTNVEGVSNSSSRVPSLRDGGASDGEFSPGNASSDDDEETIAQAEKDNEQEDVNDEIAALQKESEMDLDAFLNELPANYLKHRDELIRSESKQVTPDDSEEDEEEGVVDKKRTVRGNKISVAEDNEEEDNDDNDNEYSAKEGSDDDEDTIMEQEENEKVDHKLEIDELNAENDMTIEELIRKYKGRDTRQSAAAAAITSKSRNRAVIEEESCKHFSLLYLKTIITFVFFIASDESSDEDCDDDEDEEDDELSDDKMEEEEADDDFGLNSLLEGDPEKEGGTPYKVRFCTIIFTASR